MSALHNIAITEKSVIGEIRQFETARSGRAPIAPKLNQSINQSINQSTPAKAGESEYFYEHEEHHQDYQRKREEDFHLQRIVCTEMG